MGIGLGGVVANRIRRIGDSDVRGALEQFSDVLDDAIDKAEALSDRAEAAEARVLELERQAALDRERIEELEREEANLRAALETALAAAQDEAAA